MWYKGNKQRCEDYNAIVSYNEGFKDTTSGWSSIAEIEGTYYIFKHENYSGAYLTEVSELPLETKPYI